ncbi:hypothetical protein TsFJ059_003399 [Trichoderma semiorbis]|uniref:Secreted protein n=1 Tax=Trichoderma semiorbis TaxID=1491008 RepID=A0A9P8HRD8_9HYPO|nr:hypothetical protein TsFJ059_003399 [Trichoderma semiorbis]
MLALFSLLAFATSAVRKGTWTGIWEERQRDADPSQTQGVLRTTGSSREPRDKGAFLLYPLQKTDQRCSTLGSIHATLSGMPVSLVGFGRIADGSSVLSSSATSDLVKPRVCAVNSTNWLPVLALSAPHTTEPC